MPATRFSDIEQRPTLPEGPFRSLVGAIAQHFLEERKVSKGKGKAGANPLTHGPWCPRAPSKKDNAAADDSSDSDGDADDDEDDSSPRESRSSTPAPTLAAAGCANARQQFPDPILDVDRQMSAYEVKKSLERMSGLIKINAEAIISRCEIAVRRQAQATLEETIENDEKIDGRFDSLERALESLSGMAIAAANRVKQQQTLLGQISARLTSLEK